MKVNIKPSAEGPLLVLGEIYCNTVLETSKGNQLAVCMRDDTFEVSVVGVKPKRWFRVNPKTGAIDEI
jgi:hypothetical protein